MSVALQTPFFKVQFWLARLNNCVVCQTALEGGSEEEMSRWVPQNAAEQQQR